MNRRQPQLWPWWVFVLIAAAGVAFGLSLAELTNSVAK